MEHDNFKSSVKNCDILLAPHHGRQSAYHSDFVSHVNPRLTIISDGSICDTSANPSYSQKSRGWTVYSRKTGNGTDRRLLTTNHDGEVYVTFGYDVTGTFLHVQTEM